MNRPLLGMLAVVLTVASVRPCPGQGPGYPMPYRPAPSATFPAQQAIYYPGTQPAHMSVYPAGGAMAASAVQPPVQGGIVYPADPALSAPPVAGPVYADPAIGGMGGSVVPGPSHVVTPGATPGVPIDASTGPIVGGGCDAAGCDDAGCDGGCFGGRLGIFGLNLFGGCGFGGCGLGGCGGGDCYGAGDGCGAGGGAGDGLCFGGYNGMHCGKQHGPFGSGGCCLPRWFDVQAEWLFWQRDLDESLTFASLGILGPDVLNANQLDFSEESGYRITGAYLLGVATSLEFGYFGGLNWASGARVTSANADLFSVFSDFGSNPLNGFPETDFAFLQEIGLSSELDNAEINLRHRWVSANCVLHHSVLVGARYFRLREDLIYATQTDLGAMDYRLKTDNDLVGAQIGYDTHVCITPRLKVGAEAEAGVYGTSSSQRTTMTSTIGPDRREFVRDNDVAFLGEAGVSALFRATSRLTLRVGYQVLFVDGVALAMDNFNTASPFSARDAFLENHGDVFYHGATLGFEWTH